MRSWMERMKWNLQGWMQGRYGQDDLSVMLSRMALLFLVVSHFFPNNVLMVLALGCLIVAAFRSLSKNIDKRQTELAAYQRIIGKPRAALARLKYRWSLRKIYRYFKCSCGTVLRVPRGRGKVELICPQCHARLIRKS